MKLSKLLYRATLCVVALVFFSLNTFAQQREISGMVRSSSGEAMAGVTVTVKGTSKSVTSDVDGKFKIDAAMGSTLVLTSVGYQDRELKVNNTNLDVVLQVTDSTLNEVVVVGYGTQKKGEVTSAISSVSSKDFVKGPIRDAGQLIQGKVAGLSVSTTSGDPNAGTQIRLRGVTSLLSSSTPLILIDGVPGQLNTVAPEDIESIDVLKDGSAAAIYGTRGTNGVILITTVKRKGGSQPASLSYSGYASVQEIAKKMDFLTAADYRRLISEGVKGFNQNLDPTKPGYTTVNGANDDWGASTDWFKEITQVPVSQTHDLTLQGGNGQTNYTASVNYRDWMGIFKRTNNEQLVGRININHSMFAGKLKFNFNAINRSQKNFVGPDYNWVYRQALIRNPTEPVKTETGDWYERDVYMYQNPVRLIDETREKDRTQETRLNGSVTLSPVRDLNIQVVGFRQ